MLTSIATAVDRLNQQLPLAARQRSLTPELLQLHRAILRSLYETGEVPAGMEAAAVSELAALDLVVLQQDGSGVAGAYPMTTEPTQHLLVLHGRMVHAMCALDALSVTAMFGGEIEIRSSCRITGAPVTVRQRGETIVEAVPASVRVGVGWQQPCGGHAAHSMCVEMVFLKDEAAAQVWHGGDLCSHSVFSLPEAVEFGAEFFRPLVG